MLGFNIFSASQTDQEQWQGSTLYGTAFECSVEQVANYFVNYLFDQYQGSRHVRRIASWVGLIVLGVEAERIAREDKAGVEAMLRRETEKILASVQIRQVAGHDLKQIADAGTTENRQQKAKENNA